jgi:hypothetical protein
MLRQGGTFYFSVPFGRQRIEFHAHRVFSLVYLVEMLSPYYRIDAFSYVDASGDFHPNVSIPSGNSGHSGCAIFELTKQ